MKEHETHVLYIVNSIINKPGNIGYRIGKIIDSNQDDDKYISVFCRGGKAKGADYLFSLGLLGNFARFLTALRIYFYRKLRVRRYDKLFFEFMFFLFGSRLVNDNAKYKVAHVVEYSEYIIKYLRKKGYTVILDAPMAPTSYSKGFQHSNDRLLNELYEEHYDSYMEKSERQAFNSANYINVPSDFVYEEIIKLGVSKDKIIKIPFGADLSFDNVVTSSDKVGVDFVFAGQLSKRKGLSYLLDAWNCDEFKSDRLHLCGRARPEITRIIESLKLSNVFTPGFVDTKSFFSSCDVYVFPSIWEGSSKSIYEAMSSGLPVITTFESGSIIKDGVDGYVIDKCNVEQLKEKMIKLKNDHLLIRRMGESAKKTVGDYTWVRYAENCYGLYDKVRIR